jgi:SAM-dependent methyltransferase
MLRLTSTSSTSRGDVIWHDVECGGYEADLALWEELADEAVGSILDLGCGAGRVGLHLARRGHLVTGIDSDPTLVAAFNERAGGLPASGDFGDARQFDLGREFGLVLAPMQLVQLFANRSERIACLSCAASHIRTGDRVAVAIVENVIGGTNRRADGSIAETQVLPDVREADGWVYSSLPLETVVGDGEIVVRRLRQTVSPEGELGDEVDEVRLRMLDAGTLEHEAGEAGLRPAGRRFVPATDAHVGSTVVLLERAA